jgi:HK97 family phage major capsid protein
MEMLLPELLGERIGRLLNEAITIGDGVSKPTGIVPSATASGVVAGGSGANPTVTIDNWYDLKYSVDPAYRNAPAATRGFMMHDRYLAAIRKSKDAQGRYFADPFNSGPGTLDGDPIHINADVPTTGVNARIGCYGDYSRYLARQVMAVTFFRLDQIRIRDGVIVFMALARWDGKLLNSSAVKTIAAPAA